MLVSYDLTFLQFCSKGKSECLIAGHLGDGVTEEDELVIRLALILAYLMRNNVGHCGSEN
jgi:hypothetical protein